MQNLLEKILRENPTFGTCYLLGGVAQ